MNRQRGGNAQPTINPNTALHSISIDVVQDAVDVTGMTDALAEVDLSLCSPRRVPRPSIATTTYSSLRVSTPTIARAPAERVIVVTAVSPSSELDSTHRPGERTGLRWSPWPASYEATARLIGGPTRAAPRSSRQIGSRALCRSRSG